MGVDEVTAKRDDRCLDIIQARVKKIEEAIPPLATKSDMDYVCAELRAEFSELRAHAEEIRADIHKAITENAKWTHGVTTGAFTALALIALGVPFVMWHASRRPPAQATLTTAPVIINVPPVYGAPTSPPAPPASNSITH
ncbi:hypothetical protein [Robbsia andropogonis]|uniref:hypothetical protein n=1 Tax=Robbsia andropogonis TaxID=28092 RepID=UPI00209DCDF5|nr:hypothetical protein [Robbsia andropogonis]